MELILAGIIVLQFVYIIFKDVKVGQERENMLLKLMSKDVQEYKDATNRFVEESTKSIVEDRIPVEDASVEQLLKAE
jgi:hypothetical protein